MSEEELKHNHNHEECHCHEHDEHHHEHEHEHHDHEHGCSCGHSHGHSHSHGEEEEAELSVKALIFSAVLFILGVAFEHLPFVTWFPVLGSSLPGIKVPLNELICLVLFFAAYIIPGKGILVGAVKNILHGEFLDEQFLMAISSIGAIILGEYPEAAAYQMKDLRRVILEQILTGRTIHSHFAHQIRNILLKVIFLSFRQR